ncbi:DUF1697 domain-containing protein [Arthrobacter antibioticus]|uniref:DUF1697 domain-containing protein n=1 Tax=Arthrobacter sp. H35-MC1 TaxID=3046203 RepID=UPI0024BB3914|nr:DUF1697 domain-containing protein [Arthrobacter sp. H35-MC1]MDJ0315624.1 DUF1697 domain-containing protein [Arthrobacter sp. H35-MC1]
MSKHVAFFRYVNFGKLGSPTSKDLVDAFGGPDMARNHQTNGTIIFHSDTPKALTRAAVAKLRASGFSQEVIVRPLGDLVRIVAEQSVVPAEETLHKIMVSFFDYCHTELPREVPFQSTNGLVETRRLTQQYAISACWIKRRTVGDATVLLERVLGVPVTSRTMGTLERLIKKYSSN